MLICICADAKLILLLRDLYDCFPSWDYPHVIMAEHTLVLMEKKKKKNQQKSIYHESSKTLRFLNEYMKMLCSAKESNSKIFH